MERAETGYHLPVMADEVLGLLVTDPEGLYLDATLGGGGHAGRIAERLGARGGLIGLDRDREAVERNRDAFAGDSRVAIHQAEFSRAAEFCPEAGLAGAFFDLGVSSRQLDARERGFSFAAGTALDMRMGQDEGATAAELLLAWSEDELAGILRRNADIDEARRLARAIKALAGEGPDLTSDLVRKAVDQLPGLRDDKRNSMLARIFQAIRMEVNRELDEIGRGLQGAVRCLRKGGRLCVLSYHSVEDRKVKETFAKFEKECVCPPGLPVCICGSNHRLLRRVVRRPLLPTDEERARNPRARSAKLRVVEKL